jgi:hypothetical protein
MQNQPTNTEILTDILDLCETHLNEGDYLRASNLLKNIHENEPIIDDEITIRFPTPLKVCIFDDIAQCESFTILGVVKHRIERRLIVKKIIFSVYGNEGSLDLKETHSNFRFRCDRFKKLLKSFFIKELTYEIAYNDQFNVEAKHKLKDHYKFLKSFDRSTRDDDDDDYEECLDLDYVYKKFLEFVVDRIIETIDFIVDEE